MTAAGVRSWLFTPGNRPDRYATARASGTDAMILDWEDAVAPTDKRAARSAAVAWLASGHRGPQVWVRINDRRSQYWEQDIEAIGAAGAAGLTGVVLPKTQSDADIADTTARLGATRLPIVALIESALGVENATTIALHPSVVALALGSADLKLDANLGDDDTAWIYPRSRLVFASRAAGLTPPIDGPEMSLDDTDTVRYSANHARGLGFGAKLCVHPKQIRIVNEAFSFDASSRRWAQQVIAAADSSGGGAVRVNGEMVDRPRLALARQIMAATPLTNREDPNDR